MSATPETGGSGLGGNRRRLALVIATGTYADKELAQLRAPGRDAADLATVLGDAAIGEFEVETLLDAPAEKLRRQVAHFCSQVSPGDLALVYLSCHGVLDDRGRLYYAATDTDRGLLAATALPAAWLNEQLEDCRGRRQILVLDCCHSGAFAKGAKGESELALGERFEGRGRVVLTGSRGTEYSFEQDEVVGSSSSSVFTGALITGLRSGDADRDGDGVVSVGELYDYAFDSVRAKEARQTPTLWTYGAEGDIAVARSPRGPVIEPVPLPEDLLMLLESARPRVRESGVHELTELLNGDDVGRALTARAELERIAAEDVAGVAAAARAALADAEAPAGPVAPPNAPPPAEPPAPSTPAPGAGSPSPPPRRRRATIVVGAGLVLVALVAAVVVALGGGNGGSSPMAVPAGGEKGTIALGGSPRGIAVSNHVTWVSRYDAGEVTKIDSESQTAEPVAVGKHPDQIAAGEGSVWVSIEDGKRVVRVEPGTERSSWPEIEVATNTCQGCAATSLVISGGRLWVGEEGAIRSYDLETGREMEQNPFVPEGGFEGVFTVGKGIIWAVGNDVGEPPHSSVIEIVASTREHRITGVGRNRSLSAITFGNNSVWVADSGDARNTISAFYEQPGKLRQIAKLETGITSDDLAFAKGYVIVWDPVEGIITRVPANEANEALVGRKIEEFARGKRVNLETSDLAIEGEFAWVTEPSGGKVYKRRF